MNKETIDLIVYVLSSAVTIATAVVSVIAGIKGKGKKAEEGKHKVHDYLCEVMAEVEKFTNFTGAEKYEYVLTKVNQYCIDNGLKFDAELTAENIEKMINFSKGVNSGKSREHRL